MRLPNELEQAEFSRFVARQNEKWTQANVDKMSIQQMKMIHVVKLIPDRKLKEECAEILTKENASLDEIEKKVAVFESAKNLAARMSGTKDQVQDKANATFNKWKRPNRAERSNTTISYCNRCNSSGHRTSDCKCSKSMVCVDCKGTRHCDRYSGYCSWNTTNFMLPVEKRTPDNPKIKRPTQENAGGTQPQRNSRYVDSC